MHRPHWPVYEHARPYWPHRPYTVYMAELYTKQGAIKLSKMLKVGSRQNLKKRMDVCRVFYLQKKNVFATMFECTMHQFHEKMN